VDEDAEPQGRKDHRVSDELVFAIAIVAHLLPHLEGIFQGVVARVLHATADFAGGFIVMEFVGDRLGTIFRQITAVLERIGRDGYRITHLRNRLSRYVVRDEHAQTRMIRQRPLVVHFPRGVLKVVIRSRARDGHPQREEHRGPGRGSE